MAWDRIHPRLTTRSAWIDHTGDLPIIEGTLIRRDRTITAWGHSALDVVSRRLARGWDTTGTGICHGPPASC